jgi:hypothetical protein
VVSVLSSDIEEALELLSLSPTRDQHSPLLKLCSSSGSHLFDDWPESNDMVVSVYVALIANPSSSHASTVSASHCTRKSFTDGSSTRQSRTQGTSSQKPQWRKSAFNSAS